MEVSELGYMVAEVLVLKDIVFRDEDGHRPIQAGEKVTISALRNSPDVKLWAGKLFSMDPSYVDWQNPVKIIGGPDRCICKEPFPEMDIRLGTCKKCKLPVIMD